MANGAGSPALSRHNRKMKDQRTEAEAWLDQGLTAKQVADRTGLSQNTIRTYIRQRIRASGVKREIFEHQVVLDGQTYVDEYYLSCDLGVSLPWITLLLKRHQVKSRQAIGRRGSRKETVFSLKDCQQVIVPLIRHLDERDHIRSLVAKEYSDKPSRLTEKEWWTLVALVKYMIYKRGRSPRLVRLASYIFDKGVGVRGVEEATASLAKKGFIEIELDKAESKTSAARFYTLLPTCPPPLITRYAVSPGGERYLRTWDFVKQTRELNGVGK